MASTPRMKTIFTENEYLTLERASQERHEYLDGDILLMAGESPAHATICTNCGGQLYNQLRRSVCQVWSKDSKVRSGPIPKSSYSTQGLYSFPDLVVVCGDPQFLDEHLDVLVNPRVIVEVLSPTTEAFDRGEKFLRYRTYLDSLTDYVMVAQNRPLIEHFARNETGQWVIAATATDLSQSVELSSIGCTLRLSEVYDRVVFTGVPEEQLEPANA